MSPARETVHGVALLIGESGLLVTGASGAGKSSFFLHVATHWRHDPVRLVADDRVRLTAASGRLVARPVDGFLGRVEVRGFGMALAPAMPAAVVRAIVALRPGDPERMPQDIENTKLLGVELPCFALRQGVEAAAAFMTRWPYFRAFVTKV
jgi:serine kinase of HPr protein (carbohydrate metabolism regulator)